MAREIVRVRLWESGLALVQTEAGDDIRLQPADNALRAAMAGKTEAYFEAWLPDREADWIIGAEVCRE